ncbi:MAG: hypothetical protein J6R91_03575 [Bacteroidaceae bacterium]|nr:hypothetical protein [Bacteroidaceae bacterium]
MKNFSFNRFCNVMHHDLTEHRRTYLTIAGVLIITFTLTHLLGYLIEETPDRFVVQLAFIGLTQIIGANYSLSSIYAHIDTKEHRIENFMLPASNFEKALVRHVLAIIGFNLIFIASYLCSELFNALYVLALEGISEVPQHSLLLNWSNALSTSQLWLGLNEILPSIQILFACVHIFTSSLFVLASAYFRKHAFVKTMLIMFIINPMTLTAVPGKLFLDSAIHSELTVCYSLFILTLAGTTVYFAYRHYCRIQVI